MSDISVRVVGGTIAVTVVASAVAVQTVGQQGPSGPSVPDAIDGQVLYVSGGAATGSPNLQYDPNTGALSVVGNVEASDYVNHSSGSAALTPAGLQAGSAHAIGFSDIANATGTMDTMLKRDSAGVMSVRDQLNALGGLNLASLTVDTLNLASLDLATLTVGDLTLTGSAQPDVDNTIDLGTLAAQWRTGYFGTSIVTPLVDADTVAIGGAGSTATAQLYFTGATNNWIDFGAVGLAAPAVGTRSVGTKIVLFRTLGASAYDIGMGVESGYLWQSTNSLATGFKWYAGSGAAIATLEGDGDLILTGRLTADGVQFPATQVASSDPNCLDDYEEGTFTPALKFGGASVGMTIGALTGGYTKIGRLVHFRLYMTLSAKGTSTGAATITGLPFTAAAGGSTFHLQNLSFVGATYTGDPFAITSPVSSTLTLAYNNGATGAGGNITDANFSDTTTIYCSGSYFV